LSLTPWGKMTWNWMKGFRSEVTCRVGCRVGQRPTDVMAVGYASSLTKRGRIFFYGGKDEVARNLRLSYPQRHVQL